jgi:hypothetical protein
VTWTAADATNLNQFLLTGREILLARNTGAGARTVTVTSAPDALGRTGHITADSIAAGATHVYGPWPNLTGWIQSDGMLYFEGSHAEIEFAVLLQP